MDFDQLKAQVRRLGEFYKGLMQEGTDYGTIPGTPKPTLLKPGAELLRGWAGLTPEFTVNNAGTDLRAGVFNYEVKCSLYKDGKLVGEGVGSCNSLESKYRYRWVFEKELPQDIDKESLVVKWFPKKGGGHYPKYRLENENPQDLANTILKMAKKRSFIDAILTVTGASRIFTQDVEDVGISPDDSLQPGDEPESKENAPVCPIHNVVMFKKGRMKNYAHKLDDGTWCDGKVKEQSEATEQPKRDYSFVSERLQAKGIPSGEFCDNLRLTYDVPKQKTVRAYLDSLSDQQYAEVVEKLKGD